MKPLLLILFPVMAFSQTYQVPSVILDSLIFETIRGRQCDSVLVAKNTHIEKLYQELSGKDRQIALHKGQYEAQEFITKTWEYQYKDLQELNRIEAKGLKRKVRNRTFLVIGEGVLIILLII